MLNTQKEIIQETHGKTCKNTLPDKPNLSESKSNRENDLKSTHKILKIDCFHISTFIRIPNNNNLTQNTPSSQI